MNQAELIAGELERIAYTGNNSTIADLYARISDLEAERDRLSDTIDSLKEDSLSEWNKKHGDADQYREFFHGCFRQLAGEYPAPSVSSEYDKSVIFDAILKGETE